VSDLRLRPDGLFWRESGGDVVALDGVESVYLAANRTGAVLWKRLAEGTSTAELVGVLRDRYGISEDVAERDVAAFVASLRARSLLET
jgi:Coenzyme PQQ synthesis protein D (PqqD)